MKVKDAVAKILNNSLVIPGNERATAVQEQTALEIFKEVVAEYETTSPYSIISKYDNAEQMQAAKYVKVQTVNVITGNIPVPLTPMTNVDYYSLRDITDRQGLPDRYTLDPVTQMIVVFPGDQAGEYKYEVLGELSFDSFSLTTELPSSYPAVYIKFIILETAMRMCAMFNESKWTPLKVSSHFAARKRYQHYRKIGIPSQNRQEMTSSSSFSHLPNFEGQINRS